MNELPPQIEIEQPKPGFQEMVQRVYETMKEQGLYAVNAYFSSQMLELANNNPQVEAQLEEKLVKRLEQDRNGYLIIEGAHPDRETVIFKMKLEGDRDARGSGKNEQYFYEDLAPELEENWPADLREVELPELYDSGQTEEGSYIAIKYINGERVGHIYDTEKPMSTEEFTSIAKFIRFFQETLTLEKVKTLSLRIELKDGEVPGFDLYKNKYNKHAPMLTKMLGEECTHKMGTQLDDAEELLKNTPEIFTNTDIIPSNIIRSEDGKLNVFDWERLKSVRNSAAAYGHLIEAHWQWPQLQEDMIQRAIELNSDIPNFKELLRLDMIFYKYSIGCWWGREKEGNTPKQQEKYEACSKALVDFLKKATGKEGVWAN